MSSGRPPVTDMKRSTRDPGGLQKRLEAWLRTRFPSAEVSGVRTTSTTGLSSETLLFEASWVEDGTACSEALVARLAPDPADVPVFPSYDMDRQFRVIRRVGELTEVPVPEVFWSEPDPAPLGTPFFVMGQVSGEVPPDVMPYNFGDSWLYHASLAEQRRLQDASVAVLAALHEPPAEEFGFLHFDVPGDTALRRHVAHTRDWYDFVGLRSSVIDRLFGWLEDRWPGDEDETVLSWGDARIGNVLYRDFEPVAVLDWEMSGLGPRELDVAWMTYGHRVFQDIAATFSLEGMPEFMRPEDVAGTYERLSGHTPRHLGFYQAYAALQYSIVFLRTGARAVHFGEREMPDDPDELLYNREPIEGLLGGEPWD